MCKNLKTFSLVRPAPCTECSLNDKSLTGHDMTGCLHKKSHAAHRSIHSFLEPHNCILRDQTIDTLGKIQNSRLGELSIV